MVPALKTIFLGLTLRLYAKSEKSNENPYEIHENQFETTKINKIQAPGPAGVAGQGGWASWRGQLGTPGLPGAARAAGAAGGSSGTLRLDVELLSTSSKSLFDLGLK